MNYIERVDIEGFWGARSINFKFHEDVNFIIGINGSGKTTAVNIVVAALTVDFSELDRLEFSKIIIRLKSKHSRKKPSVTIIKQPNDEFPFSSIQYEIKESSSKKAINLPLDDYMLHRYRRSHRYPRHILEREKYKQQSHYVNSILKKLVNVSWLSVNRSSNDDEGEGQTVDRKLQELSDRLVRYFSTLGKEASDELENFQKKVFLSMLFNKNRKKISSMVKNIDAFNSKNSKQALERIFNQFKVEQEDFKNQLDGHFDMLSKAKENLLSDNSMLEEEDISVLISTERIDYIVKEWEESIEKRNIIFNPKDTFLKVINTMMQRKEFSINSSNEIQIITQSGKDLHIKNLSSGEKQLLIVLGEALLQENKSWIYIADEPELSLHVRWQESLVQNLRAINPNAQIIFATHSPDVVSTFNKKVFDMEKLFNVV